MGRRREQAHRRRADGASTVGGARVEAARSGLCAGHRGTATQPDRPRRRDAGRAGRRMAHQPPHDPIGAHADRRRARARRGHRPADHRADGRRAGRAGRAAQSVHGRASGCRGRRRRTPAPNPRPRGRQSVALAAARPRAPAPADHPRGRPAHRRAQCGALGGGSRGANTPRAEPDPPIPPWAPWTCLPC